MVGSEDKGFGSAKRLCSFDFVKFVCERLREGASKSGSTNHCESYALNTEVESNIPHVLNV